MKVDKVPVSRKNNLLNPYKLYQPEKTNSSAQNHERRTLGRRTHR